jgi:hypothetical protein
MAWYRLNVQLVTAAWDGIRQRRSFHKHGYGWAVLVVWRTGDTIYEGATWCCMNTKLLNLCTY